MNDTPATAKIMQTAADMELARRIIREGVPFEMWGHVGITIAGAGSLAMMTVGKVDGAVYLMQDGRGYTLLTGKVASIARTIIEERC